MSIQDEIAKAIRAHGVWKLKLHTAIDIGKSEANAADVAKDNVCAFGQWLYGPTLPANVRASADFNAVRKLHADFHKCAALVIECVGQGNKAKAESLMHGDYAKISSGLTAALMKWRAAAQ